MARQRGFTLIELMIVLAVIAIIAAIALPTFTEQIRKSRRAEAMNGLSDLQLRQEKWRSNHATYGTLADIGGASNPYYTLTVTTPTATGYVLTAAPTSGGPQVGDRCGSYILTNTAGVIAKTVSTSLTNCW